ncbi:hypothetical protein HY642_00860 [Candidatus Woesearchaeota archaeon]|nr:hypothetical protein [Candidatus Woesearchaeota archaeon]
MRENAVSDRQLAKFSRVSSANSRKSQVDVQANWIFILIAGAVILAFFFNVVAKQKEFAEQKRSISLLTDFDALLNAAEQAKGAAQSLAMPSIKANFRCDEACRCEYGIGSIQPTSYRDKILFSSNKIEGNNIVLWTLDWKLPFRITNFIYATNDRVKYFFIYDDSDPESKKLKAQLERDLPSQVNAEYVTFDQIHAEGPCAADNSCAKNENYIRVKFVLLNLPANITVHSSFADTDWNFVGIYTPNRILYYPKGKPGVELKALPATYYANKESMYGAIFADDKTMYECQMRVAFGRAATLAEIYRKRIAAVQQPLSQQCIYPAEVTSEDTSTGLLARIASEAEKQLATISDPGVIQGTAAKLGTLNEELTRKQGRKCPIVY